MFYSKMMSVCIRYSSDNDEAKDLLQDGFMKLFMNISKYDHSGSFEGWIKRMFVNHSIDSYRKKQKDKIITSSELIENANEELYENEEQVNERYNFNSSDVMKEIQNLSPVYRTVFNLYVLEGYTHKEIAETLGINEGTSKSNLAKAKANLKKRLLKNG